MSLLVPFEEIEGKYRVWIKAYNRKVYAIAIQNALNNPNISFTEQEVEDIIADIDLRLTRSLYDTFSNIDTRWLKSVSKIPDYKNLSRWEWLFQMYSYYWTQKWQNIVQLNEYIKQEMNIHEAEANNPEWIVKYEYFKVKLDKKKFIEQNLQSKCPFKKEIYYLLWRVYDYLISEWN